MVTLVLAAVALQSSLVAQADFGDGASQWKKPEGAVVFDTSDYRVGKAMRMPVGRLEGKPIWDEALAQVVAVPIAASRSLELSFWARSPEGCRVSAFVQSGKPPFPDAARRELKLTPDWARYALRLVSPGYAAGEAIFGLHLNLDKGIVEVGGFKFGDLARAPGEPVFPYSLMPASGLGGLTAAGPATIAAAGGGIRVKVSAKPEAQPWETIIHVPATQAIRSGEVVSIRAKMRSAVRSKVSFNYEMTAAPNSKFLSQMVRVSSDWREYKFAAVAPSSFAAGEARLAIFLGYGPGEVEIAELEVMNQGPGEPGRFRGPIDFFGGELNPDTWRAGAEARIEKIRKGNLKVVIVDPSGNPIPGAKIQVEQVRHAFKFGTAAPAFLLAGKDETAQKFRQTLLRLFNTVTFENDLKWQTLGEPNYGAVDEAMKFLRANDIAVRGHNFVWGSRRNLPTGLWEKTDDQVRAILDERISSNAARFKGQLYLWDVVNEAVSERELWDRLGWKDFAKTFKTARAADPTVHLCYNDFNWTEENAVGKAPRLRGQELLRDALAQGAPIDVIGLQCHLGPPLTPVKRVLEIVDSLAAEFNKPMEVTEFDMGGINDPKFQAAYTADYLTAMFSHPKVQGFIWWGFWEGAHWRAAEGGAIVKRDWSSTPSLEAYEGLVKGKWWTKADLVGNARGATQVRAFYGTHRVTATLGGRTVSQTVDLPKGRDLTATIVLR